MRQRNNERTRTRRSARVVAAGVALALGSALLATVATPSPPPARAADPVCTISAKLVNSCRAWLGAESGGYGPTGFRAAMLEHESRIGRQLDIVHEYFGAGNVVLTNDVLTLARRSGTIALVNWRVANRWVDGSGGNATVNGQIDAMGRSIKALGSTKIMLTLHHEPENDISRGGDPACPNVSFSGGSGAVADYVRMWHNVRARFDALDVTNVVWVMNYMGWKTWHCSTKGLWPGNDYVDWVMWDPYPKTATWTAFVNIFYNYLVANSDAEHNFLSKPWGLAEFGFVGPDQQWGYGIYDEAKRNLNNGVHPKLKAYVVWDNDTSSSHDDRVAYDENGVPDPTEQQHYNAFANDPLLVGSGVPEPGDTTPPTVVRTAPADAATVAGTVQVTGSAADNVGVQSVVLLVDGTVVATSAPATNGSVTIPWNSASVVNGTHTLQLRARDEAGNTGVSGQISVTVDNVDDEAPGSPPNVTAVWGTPSKVTVGWGAASDNAAVTGYKVYRDGALLTTLGPAARTHVDLGVANQTPHTYGVTALDAAGHESAPGEAVVTTGDDTPPTKPTAQVTLTASDEATVEWTESTDNVGVTGYRVYRGSTLVETVTDGNRSTVDAGLDDGVTHTYRVQAYDAAGNSVASDPVAVTTEDVTAPSTPLDLRASSATASVTLSWRAATDNVAVSNYIVHRDGLPLVTLGPTATSYTDQALSGDTLHRYQVTARDAADNESTKSNEVARTLTDSELPTAPTGLVGAMSGASVRLTWTAATDNVGVTGYTVYRAGTAIGTSTTPAYTDSTPLRGRTSSYTVRARDAAGNLGPASTAVNVNVPADTSAPSSPSGLRATVGAVGSRQITVAWNASTDNVGVANYYLFRGNSKYRLLGNVTSFLDTGLTAGTRYTYKVYALDAAGNWSGSSGNLSVTAR